MSASNHRRTSSSRSPLKTPGAVLLLALPLPLLVHCATENPTDWTYDGTQDGAAAVPSGDGAAGGSGDDAASDGDDGSDSRHHHDGGQAEAGQDAGGAGAGGMDAGNPGAGGGMDAGHADAGGGGGMDAGHADAGGGMDAGHADAGGTADGGHPDAGGGMDAGHPDAGGGNDAGSPPTGGLQVQGNHFVDNGNTVRLLGVNHAGTEYTCVGGGGIFEGPSDATLVGPMKQWHINTVRVPLNEDCWLGINGVAASVSGTNYQQAIASYVQMLRANGMYVVVDLHWNAPGGTLAKAQQPMPDADHAPAFWTSVANTFKGDLGVVFDLYNEPYPDLGTSNPGPCLRDGCSLSNWSGYSGSAMAVGMQSLVNTVRNTGARNVILVAGWGYANYVGSWLQFAPTDPLNNLGASFHLYNPAGCNTASCWSQQVAPVAAKVPVVTGELGETDCAQSFVDSYFSWADPAGVSYLGWAWNVQNCSSFPALITDYNGTPTALGQGFKTHLPTQQ